MQGKASPSLQHAQQRAKAFMLLMLKKGLLRLRAVGVTEGLSQISARVSLCSG